jgi:hypothetical protein
MAKKNKAPEAKSGNEPHASKWKQQSAPLASAVSMMEKAKKPKAVATEATLSSPPPPAEVAKGTSGMNVAEDERIIAVLPKYVAVPRVVIGAASVEPVAVEEVLQESSSIAKLPSSVAGIEDTDKGEDNEDGIEGTDKAEDDEDEETEKAEDDDDEDGTNDEDSEYAPAGDDSDGDGTVDIADDADNLPDEVKPGQKVSSPFDLLILPIARTFLVEKGKKRKKVPDGNEESLLLLSNEEAPLKKKEGKLATKLPAAGRSSKVGTSNSSEDVLIMIKGVQEEFFNLPWKSYVSVFVLFTFLFSYTFM